MSEEAKFNQARNCVFTLNNYTEEEWFAIKAWKCDYLIVGKERGENNTPHLQGYVEWHSAKKWSTLKKLNSRIHWESRRGTAKQASDYCKKDGDFFESGEISNQGSRGDLAEVTTFITDNRPTIEEVMMAYPVVYVKYARNLEKMVDSVRMDERKEKPKVAYLWGKAGTGKTRTAMAIDPKNTYVKDNTKWWNGYTGQRVVIFDDWNPPPPGTQEWRNILTWLDRYPCSVETKGGYVKLNSEIMVVTSEYDPKEKYHDNSLDQLMRRIDTCVEVVAGAEVNLGF